MDLLVCTYRSVQNQNLAASANTLLARTLPSIGGIGGIGGIGVIVGIRGMRGIRGISGI